MVTQPENSHSNRRKKTGDVNPAIASEVARYRTLCAAAAAAEAFDEALAESIPDRLLALLRPAATVADIATAHVART